MDDLGRNVTLKYIVRSLVNLPKAYQDMLLNLGGVLLVLTLMSFGRWVDCLDLLANKYFSTLGQKLR